MSELQELCKLKSSLVAQASKVNSEIKEVSDKINELINQDKDALIKEFPYYKDRNSVLYVTKCNSTIYIVTKIVYTSATVLSISTFDTRDIDFLKCFQPATKLDWTKAINQLNSWLRNSNIKIEDVGN